MSETCEVKPDGDRFGELAVALGLIEAGPLRKALAQQATLKRRGIHKRIGQVLLEQHRLNPRAVQKVLLEQQRKRKASGKAGASSVKRKIGPYELLAKLGEGGMGAVYKARDPSMDRVVALKVLSRNLTGNQQFLDRFKREAKATGALNHPNIITAYGAGEAQGIHYLAMELVEGESLGALVKTLGRLEEKKALKLVKSVAAGLGHAHAHGFVHRDIKPDNVLLGKNGAVKVVDLGLARAVDEESRLTMTGTALGTPHYISPEQARGQKEIDRRTDIYSLGATLYVLLTGQTPFHGANNAEIMRKHLKEDLENPQDLVPGISDGCVAIVSKMMAKSPGERYDNCEELIEDLELVLAGKAPRHAAAAESQEHSSIRPPRRRRRRVARPRASESGCLVLLLLLPMLAWALQVLGPRLLAWWLA